MNAKDPGIEAPGFLQMEEYGASCLCGAAQGRIAIAAQDESSAAQRTLYCLFHGILFVSVEGT